jgi:hypothetical protein
MHCIPAWMSKHSGFVQETVSANDAMCATNCRSGLARDGISPININVKAFSTE